MDDLISRQTVKEQMLKYGFSAPDMTVTEFVEDLPSVQPERIRGKWVNYGEGECCDQCGRYPYDDGEFHILGWRSNFCPHCGADMREDTDHGTN